MTDNTLSEIRRRREAVADSVARAMHDAATGPSPMAGWDEATNDLKAHWLFLAGVALDVVERFDDGLVEWLAEVEELHRDRMTNVARDMRSLADRLAGSIDLPPRRHHGQQP